MPKYHLQREVGKLKKQILSLGTLVEENFSKSMQAFEHVDTELAKEVIMSDRQIDLQEVEVEEECLKILALHQPVAVDLRFIIAVLKINNDLERIGDLAVNIAQQAELMAQHNHKSIYVDFDLSAMAKKVQIMVHHSLDALINMDAILARKVCRADDEVDSLHHEMLVLVETETQRDPKRVELLIHFAQVSRNLERVADQATNIAEDVIYMVEGEIVRHRMKNFIPKFPKLN